MADTIITNTLINASRDLAADTAATGDFGIGWLVLLLGLLAGNMLVMFVMREHHETLFFALTAGVLAAVLAIIFTAPVDFVISESVTVVTVGTLNTVLAVNTTDGTYSAEVIRTETVTDILPRDPDFSVVLSAWFGILAVFNFLYAIFIMSNFDFAKRVG